MKLHRITLFSYEWSELENKKCPCGELYFLVA